MKRFGREFLTVYSAVLSTAVAVTLLSRVYSRRAKFDVIQVQRINIVEGDGTLRTVISNRDCLPPVIVKGREHPELGEPRPQAGILFYNDEGSENGGLIFGGRQDEKGEVVDSGVSLSFDKYGAKQIVQLAGVDDKTNRFAGLAISEKRRRVWVGRTDDGNASVLLMDADGRPRIVMQVTQEGKPTLSFLDENGQITQHF